MTPEGQSDKERFVCLKCYNVGPLDDALRCVACQSDTVASVASLEAIAASQPTTPLPSSSSASTTSVFYYYITLGPFECVVSSRDAASPQDALRVASQRTWFASSEAEADLARFSEASVTNLSSDEMRARR